MILFQSCFTLAIMQLMLISIGAESRKISPTRLDLISYALKYQADPYDISSRQKRQSSGCFSNPCNKGQCYDLQTPALPSGGYYCVCPVGFSGTQCEIEINECLSNPCQNNARCLDLVGSFFCACPTGFTGITCENKPEQICPPGVCGTGECVSTTHPTYQYACKCSDGTFKFEPCLETANVSACAGNSCGGKQCIEAPSSPSGYLCQCGTNDYRPTNCDKEEPICPENSCGTGECVATTHPSYQFVCKCTDGSFRFEPCTAGNNTSQCMPNPCGQFPCYEAPTSPSGFVCACDTNDFRPTSCEQSTCQIDSCLNGGYCIPYSANEPWCSSIQAGRTCCQCPTGYTGYRCETEIDECVSSPCRNGGVCENLANSYRCVCPSNFSGVNCDTPVRCLTNPCKFGGACVVVQGNQEACVCRPGFTGAFCETDVNECLSSPCGNGGTCVDLENSYACYCPDGFFRPNNCPAAEELQTTVTTTQVTTTTTAGQLNQCEPNPCRNTGTCITFTNGIFYSCFCQYGYSGRFCEILPTTTAMVQQPIYTQQVTQKSSTQKLQTVVTEASVVCNPNPCFNEGICHSQGCICPSGYEGHYCEKIIESRLCENVSCKKGTCHVVVKNETKSVPECWCQAGYSGAYCEIRDAPNTVCSSTTCLNGGTCVDNPSLQNPTKSFCNCRAGFTGQRCETEYFKCKQNGISADIYGCNEGRYLECVHFGEANIGFAQGVLYRRECPPGLRYSPAKGYCDYAYNVQC